MKRLNLLPEHLLPHRAHRHRLPLRMLTGAAALVLITWVVAAVAHIGSLGTQITAAEHRLDPLRRQRQDLRLVKSDGEGPEKRTRTIEKSHDSVSPVQILALLSQLAPDEMVLCSLSVEYPRPVPKRSSEATDIKQEHDAAKLGHIQLDGMATADVAIGSLINQLAKRGFHNVRIEDSKEGVFNGHHCYLFRTSMDIPMITNAAGAEKDVQQ